MMASVLEVALVAEMSKRAELERKLHARITRMEAPHARMQFARLCVAWMEQHGECNELARELADSIEHERGAA